MSEAGERLLAAQQGLLETLNADPDEAAVGRARGRLEQAFEAFREAPEVDAATLGRLRTLAALLERALEGHKDAVSRELGRTRLALELIRRRSMGPRSGRRFDVSG